MTCHSSVVPIILLIARSKLVPDFVATIHFVHLICVSLYVHAIPTYPVWWFLQMISTILMTVLGVWACQWRELRPMAFGGKAKSTENGANASPSDVDVGVGYDMGPGGGRGRDGAGAYEMVGMTPKEPA